MNILPLLQGLALIEVKTRLVRWLY